MPYHKYDYFAKINFSNTDGKPYGKVTLDLHLPMQPGFILHRSENDNITDGTRRLIIR